VRRSASKPKARPKLYSLWSGVAFLAVAANRSTFENMSASMAARDIRRVMRQGTRGLRELVARLRGRGFDERAFARSLAEVERIGARSLGPDLTAAVRGLLDVLGLDPAKPPRRAWKRRAGAAARSTQGRRPPAR